MKHIFYVLSLTICAVLVSLNSKAQGPPITGDKPIMLGENRIVLKTLTEIRSVDDRIITSIPARVHYLPTSNTLVGIHIPFVMEGNANTEGTSAGVGDISLLGKYQFYRKDGMGKTLRVVAKTLQTLPTGLDLYAPGISTGLYEGYYGVVVGYESVRLGVSNELGFNIGADEHAMGIRYKLGFGVPLLKPTYPVNQINVYFETNNFYQLHTNRYSLLYAQGIQYAVKRWTFEGAYQFNVLETEVSPHGDYNASLILGMRYII